MLSIYVGGSLFLFSSKAFTSPHSLILLHEVFVRVRLCVRIILNECHFQHEAFYDLRTPNVLIFFCFFSVTPLTSIKMVIVSLLWLLCVLYIVFYFAVKFVALSLSCTTQLRSLNRSVGTFSFVIEATKSLYVSFGFACRFTRAIIILFSPTIMFSGHTHTHTRSNPNILQYKLIHTCVYSVLRATSAASKSGEIK